MDLKTLSKKFAVSPQIMPGEVAGIAAEGYRAILCNRPDGEGADQPSFEEIEAAAKAAGIEARYVPVQSGMVQDADVDAFGAALAEVQRPVMAYCRSGTRSATLWSFHESRKRPMPEILAATKAAGYDMNGVARRIANGGRTPTDTADARFDVVIVGAGAGGIAVAASLKAREPGLEIAVIDPADIHYYQPGWTMVGGGVFEPHQTAKTMGSLIPQGVHWIKAAVAAFEPKDSAVILDGCRVVRYDRLVVCPGLKLDWDAIEGLEDTLGRNGVTSNYRYDLAPYTWELVQGLRGGRALFTQPPMPIKCAGAPQKAMYLSGDALVPATERSEGHRHPVHERGWCAVRGQGLCPRADGVRSEIRCDAELFLRPCGGRWTGERGALSGQLARRRAGRGHLSRSICCTFARRRWRPISSGFRRWPMQRAGSMWIRPPCVTRASTISGRWVT